MINEQQVDRVGRLLTAVYCFIMLGYYISCEWCGTTLQDQTSNFQQGCFKTIVRAKNSLGTAQLQVGPNGIQAQMANWQIGLNVLLTSVNLSLMPS